MQRNPRLSHWHGAEREKKLGRLRTNIRRERTSRRLTQNKLAELAKINPKTVAELEVGELNETLECIGRAIGYRLGMLTAA